MYTVHSFTQDPTHQQVPQPAAQQANSRPATVASTQPFILTPPKLGDAAYPIATISYKLRGLMLCLVF